MAVRRHDLARRRRAAGFSQEELAWRLGVDRSTVARWEGGETTPQPRLRPELASALELSVDELDALLGSPASARTASFVPAEPEDGREALPVSLLRPVPEVSGGEHAEPGLGAFERRLHDAWQMRSRHRHPERPCLLLVGGLAGSGKTELGRFLTALTGWVHLDKDVLTRPLTECLLRSLDADPNDRHTGLYVERVRPLEYRALMNAAFESLRSSVSTVVSAPFLRELPDDRWLARLNAHCARHGIDIALIWVDADAQTMYSYLQARDAARDSWKLDHWDDYLDSVDLGARPSAPYFLVDNRQNAALGLADQAQRLVESRLVDR